MMATTKKILEGLANADSGAVCLPLDAALYPPECVTRLARELDGSCAVLARDGELHLVCNDRSRAAVGAVLNRLLALAFYASSEH